MNQGEVRKGGYGAICGLVFPVCMQRIQDGGEVGLIWFMTSVLESFVQHFVKLVLEMCYANKVA